MFFIHFCTTHHLEAAHGYNRPTCAVTSSTRQERNIGPLTARKILEECKRHAHGWQHLIRTRTHDNKDEDANDGRLQVKDRSPNRGKKPVNKLKNDRIKRQVGKKPEK